MATESKHREEAVSPARASAAVATTMVRLIFVALGSLGVCGSALLLWSFEVEAVVGDDRQDLFE